MFAIPGFLVLTVVMAGVVFIIHQRKGLAAAFSSATLLSIFGGLAGLISVVQSELAYKIVWAVCGMTSLLCLVGKGLSFKGKIFQSGFFQVALVLTLMVSGLGWIETLTGCLARSGRIALYSPVITVMNKTGGEDWRAAHITADSSRIPDPYLMWRPVPWGVYTSQGFKGPLAETPKPAKTFRIFTYGDSNVDGPDYGGWPIDLQEYFHQRGNSQIQVINAGVAGYSSFQGLRRFKSEVDIYTPDVVLVSFGWNDLPLTTGKPDKDYHSPPVIISYILKGLYRFQFYRAMQALVPSRPASTEATQVPRVDPTDYLNNLNEFVAEGKKRNILVILMTRPHRDSEEVLKQNPTWRRNVTTYNKALRSLAIERQWLFFDAENEMSDSKFYLDECHFTREGYRDFSKRVGAFLERKGLLPAKL
mgnify:CR=1 FL=1